MKRRDFLRTAGATALIPVLPLPATAAPVSAPAPVNAMRVGWAALYARVNNHATPAMLQKWLRVGPQEAEALMRELVARNILHAPAGGTAMAVSPMHPPRGANTMFNRAPDVMEKAKQAVRDVLDEAKTSDAPSPEPHPLDAQTQDARSPEAAPVRSQAQATDEGETIENSATPTEQALDETA